MSDKRARLFSLITYLSIPQVSTVLMRHDKQIDKYAFILHDKDLDEQGNVKEPHIHILVRTVNANILTTVRNWFSGYFDDKGKSINTLGQVIKDIRASYEYLTHGDEKSRKEGKNLYPDNAIYCNDRAYFLDHNVSKDDNIRSAYLDLINGSNYYECALKYGRDFIIHYRSIKELYEDTFYLAKKKGVYDDD